MDAVDPQVDIVAARQIATTERGGLILPLRREPGDRRCRQPGTGAEELLQGRGEIAARQPVQVQQRQHLGHLRGLARPGRQDRRGEPLAFTSVGIDTFVVDPRGPHLHRTGCGQHLARLVVAVADHQSVAVVIALVSELRHVGGDLGLQRRGQHLPSAITDNLIQQRPTSTTVGVVVGLRAVVNYGEHGRTFPTSAPTPVLIEYLIP